MDAVEGNYSAVEATCSAIGGLGTWRIMAVFILPFGYVLVRVLFGLWCFRSPAHVEAITYVEFARDSL
jgi:hypothetical protein